MLRRSLVVIAVAAALATSCASSARKEAQQPAGTHTSEFPTRDELLALIKDRVDSERAVGIVLAVREPNGKRTIVSYGDPGDGALPFDAKSVFEIGSISKVFTGILLAEMAGRGEVALDDLAQKHVPEGVTIPSRGDSQIRLVDLATHSSGLPRLPANLLPADSANPYADYTVSQLHEFLSSYTLPRDVGTKVEYSNLGAGLLGHLLENVSGKSWETLISERILEPLGMSMSGVTWNDDMQKHLVRGHDVEGEPTANWDLPTLAGAGALRSNAEDLLRFLDANLDGASSPLPFAIPESHKPRVDAGPGMQIGLGWHIRTTKERQLIWHNGGTGGYRSFLGFDPKRKIGVIVLENSARGSDDIGFHLLDPSLPLAEAPKVRKEVEVAPGLLSEYVGIYEIAPQFHLNVTLVDGALYTQATGQQMIPIFAESDSEFFAKVVDAQLSFVRDASGAVTRLILHQGGADVPALRLEGERAKSALSTIVGEFPDEVTVPGETLARYAGVYELAPSFRMTVSVEDGRLLVQATGQPAFPVFAESETQFFYKVVNAKLSFVVGEDGGVSKLILHQGGMDQSAKKVE